jgi:hypothetical protein
MEDLAVAGCFATQVPREGAHPFQCVNADRHHKAGGDDDIKAALTVEEFESLAPLARLNHIGFDNVSSVIRRSVLESHPFAHCPFGEDIRWARHVILRGYAVAQSGTAQVLHSHDVNQVEFRNRAQQTHQLWRELTDYEPFPHLGWWLRRTAGQIVRLIRAALSDPTRSWGARVAIALTAPYWGWIQMRANYRGSRRGTYDPPSASR